YVENRVERPKILFDEEDITYAPASASDDPRPTDSALVVRIDDPAGANQREFPRHSVPGRQVKASLQRCHISEPFGLPTVVHSNPRIVASTSALSAALSLVLLIVALLVPSPLNELASQFILAGQVKLIFAGVDVCVFGERDLHHGFVLPPAE